MRLSILLLLLNVSLFTSAQNDAIINSSLRSGYWPASWITCPGVAQRDYGVYHFRKSIELDHVPAKFIIHVSADNRYRLFVNGKAVCSGPARGDLYNWYYETVDIAPFLQSGKNTIAALVWNMGVYAAVAQISNQTGFLIQGDGDIEKSVNSNDSWKVFHDEAYSPCSTDNGSRLRTYMVIGPGDDVEESKYPWGWEANDYNDGNWKKAVRAGTAVTFGNGSDNQWTLVPRNIPLFTETLQRIPVLKKSSPVVLSGSFLSGTPVTIPSNTSVTLLLDQTFNTLAYPELKYQKGAGSQIQIQYAEALTDSSGRKGNRNDITGKHLTGNFDVIHPDGGSDRVFRPLWFRTYRYIQLDIITKDQPLELIDFYGMKTGYPFKEEASFASNDGSLKDIWNIGWRTAQLCAGETYFDCPYYEQLQYEGDTRIQSLISLFVTGDDQLMRKAILNFWQSRVPEGLTQGRYPSNRLQVIPPFSLYWVSMIYDYWMHRSDDQFISQFLTGAKGVLDWYEHHIDRKKNMLGPMNWWNFTDWNHAFPGGTPAAADKGNSSIVTLQYVNTLLQAAPLFEAFGKKYEAAHFRRIAARLSKDTYDQCYNKTKREMADDPDQKAFSQHASIMAVLTGCIPQVEQKEVMKKVLYDTTLSQATFYYRFYLTRALKKAGMADLYYSQLTPWRKMIENGLTTFAENPDPTRSDCHAWSSSPNYDFIATICGVNPGSPGFKTVSITPSMGELTSASCSMPHPAGDIKVDLKRNAEHIRAEITLPQGLTGNFTWKGKSILLHSGDQKLTL
ncbi:MAG: hypothetical protein NVS3B19_12020 [Ginsengibacter sp.]